MKKISRLLFVCAASVLASTPNICAAAQPSSCNDDRGTDRCAGGSRAQQRRLYKVASTEDFANKQVQLVRAFFVDGYGQDIALVTFKRAPGEDLQVEVRLPDPDGKLASPPLVGQLSGAAWTDIMASAGTFDRDLVPLQKRNGELSICLHSWVSTVEVVDENGRVRRKTSSACGGDSLVTAYAFKMASIAVASFSFCSTLSPEASRNDVTRLADCWRLRGDRAAAAQAYNRLHTRWFLNPNGTDFARSLYELFYDRAEIAWPGEKKVTGAASAAQLWTAKAGQDRFVPQIYFGETQGRVRIEGQIWPRPKSDADRPQPIPVTMLWTKENGFDFRLRSLSTQAGH
ncbi:hypothetical protein [Sphingobium yanoikuyae]|uniref:Uncharacterized protein n=1 Tax=Sphingobium yanoikuyae TaxID=13690 RepID=A0A291N0F0_SPHYA|nr:hypothetical protein [Sphingobium yanoikuyae]ATI80638.1 hypothetical protein A6768_11980 [Sphingobium yanoikuyae]